MIIKTLAVLLTVWYSMSIIGFDVHTCNGSGRSFVTTFIKGLTCEDIHPNHVCDKAPCCAGSQKSCCSHHEDRCAFKAESCCSNNYQVLSLTGTAGHNDHEHFDECACGHCPCIGFSADDVPALFHENKFTAHIQSPDSGVCSACERQAALRVWRI